VEEYNYYILFPNVTEGLKLEKLLKENSIKYTIVPTPRELSKCCGICIMYEYRDENPIKLLVEKYGIKTEGFKSLPKRKSAVKFI
jgi:ribosomal protein L7Ae-like RNA K-turn-binding protein